MSKPKYAVGDHVTFYYKELQTSSRPGRPVYATHRLRGEITYIHNNGSYRVMAYMSHYNYPEDLPVTVKEEDIISVDN